MRIIALDDTSMKDILTDLLKRDPNNYGEYENTVREIVERIRKEGIRPCLNIPGVSMEQQ